MARIGVGILGAGKMARLYLNWFSRQPDCSVVAIANRTPERALPLASEFALTYYADWRELLADGRIQAIGVCTPAHVHRDPVIEAARRGIHVLCEKPLAHTLAACDDMIEAADRSGIVFATGHNMRFHPVVHAVDTLVPRLGHLLHVGIMFPQLRPGVNWRHRAEMVGGVFKENGVHLFDLGTHWAGPLHSVSAELTRAEAGREVEDHGLALGRFVNGAIGAFYCSWHDHRPLVIAGFVIGTAGQVNFSFSSYRPEDSVVTFLAAGQEERVPLRPAEAVDDVYPGHLDSYKREIDQFVDCIKHGGRPVVDGRAGRAAVEVALATNEAQRTGCRVNLPLSQFDPGSLPDAVPRVGW